jgi:hypothetical protein
VIGPVTKKCRNKKGQIGRRITSSYQQKIEDTSFNLAKVVLGSGNILSQIETAKMAIQASIEDNELKAQLSMHDSIFNHNRKLVGMK